jgi:hypothetical protein
MSRLKAALARQPDPHQAVARAIVTNYSGEIEAHSTSAWARIVQRLEAALDSIRGQLGAMIRTEVAAQMPTIPPPQITRIHETPVTQVIEKPIERTVERVVEKINSAPIKILRDKQGRIARIVRGEDVYTVQRDEDGLMSGVKRV